MNAFSERVPPQNLEAEQSVLGAMLIDRDAVVAVTNLLVPEDFYADKHQALYESIYAIFGRGEPVDLITVQDELKKRGQLDDVGGLTQNYQAAAAAERARRRVGRPSRQKCGVIRRAALQKPDTRPISMIWQRNFDCAAGFCRPLLSARFAVAPIRSHSTDLVSGTPGTAED